MHPSRVLRAAALLLASVTLTPSALAAETPQPNVPYVFVTVDSYSLVQADTIQVTGVLQGENTPRTLEFEFPYPSTNYYGASPHIARCDRLALLLMNKPGAYLLELSFRYQGAIVTCKLTRRTAAPAP
ncbi:hypothetical protein FJV41_35280 [Myxococcus llanfairpwllgwyngyllgogerychwyrndrobwllllantysiliogogogochensis]|uniref:Lipoprotein n=1 Tax=Myxococcus llanfairpwllgwyngyllgogerychwyrndrobwllllantysiliogogogochensis TaxID=2590453 RepID=A0A540WQR3_9BACT|nr:hypothetical protein [Myxococcus llanfairpwllgwyngyllgogerychwyrndrobwllllantysiliogogogochensis]TQF11237.1 hypothetical protein FJV41_35280 [Myxococcus llanfairpwllgwyngyllgogerychwyrndrobwllllantysiliogogogochensis]